MSKRELVEPNQYPLRAGGWACRLWLSPGFKLGLLIVRNGSPQGAHCVHYIVAAASCALQCKAVICSTV